VLERTLDEFGVSSGAIIAEMPETARPNGLLLSLDGKLLASAIDDETLILWNGDNLQTLGRPP
jgi:WD40 repeat protein